MSPRPYNSDDFKPDIYKTALREKTGRRLCRHSERCFYARRREDRTERLFVAGPETGMYFRQTNRRNVAIFTANMPITPITDWRFQREKELVVATQGRSFYVLDISLCSKTEATAPMRFWAHEDATKARGEAGSRFLNRNGGRKSANEWWALYLKSQAAKGNRAGFLVQPECSQITGKTQAEGAYHHSLRPPADPNLTLGTG